MGYALRTGKTAHDLACLTAEGARQGLTAAAQSAAGQLVVNTAEIAWARAMVVSCDTNNQGFGKEPYVTLLRSLGTGGT